MMRRAAIAVLIMLAACGPRVRTPKPLPQAADIQARLERARTHLATAEARVAVADHRGAYDAALLGIDALGERYAARFTKDDTEQHLFAATYLFDAGDVADAAAEAVGALRTRIDLATPPGTPAIETRAPGAAAPGPPRGDVTATPDATDAAPFSTADHDALGEALARLADEHREGWEPAVAWLVEHPTLSRNALRDMVDAGGSAADLAVARAALALGEIGAVDDVATLARALARGGETASSDFAQALAHHRSAEALAALIEATASPSIDVVQAAAMALATRGGATARATLEALLDHPDASVRYTTVVALIDLGARPSRAALTRRKPIERDAEVRGALRKALRR